MKKTIGICLFVCSIFVLCIILMVMINKKQMKEEREYNQHHLEETQTNQYETLGNNTETEQVELAESMALPKEYAYVIFARDGILVVYQKDGKRVYFETNIKVSELEQRMLEQLDEGIYFYDEQELYDFLESYSS